MYSSFGVGSHFNVAAEKKEICVSIWHTYVPNLFRRPSLSGEKWDWSFSWKWRCCLTKDTSGQKTDWSTSSSMMQHGLVLFLDMSQWSSHACMILAASVLLCCVCCSALLFCKVRDLITFEQPQTPPKFTNRSDDSREGRRCIDKIKESAWLTIHSGPSRSRFMKLFFQSGPRARFFRCRVKLIPHRYQSSSACGRGQLGPPRANRRFPSL